MSNKVHLVKDYIFGVGFPVGIVSGKKNHPNESVDPASDLKFRSKQFRRSHVQLFACNLILVGAVGLFSGGDLTNFLFITLSLSLLITSTLIRYSILGLVDLPIELLDERERLLRAETLATSYKYLGFGAIYVLIALILWGEPLSTHHLIVVAILFSASAITLPSAMIAWKQEVI